MNAEIVIVLGFPASGKSTVTEDLVKQGYVRLNRDTLGGTVDGLVSRMAQLAMAGTNRFVLDNLYATVASRASVIEFGRVNSIPVRCIWMDTSIEDAQFNACTRMVRKYGHLLGPDEIKKAKDPNAFPPAVIFGYKKDFQRPTTTEGFSKIDIHHFVRRFDPAYTNKAILVDYDGTLRETVSGAKFPVTPGDIRVLPNRYEILRAYQKKGYIILGVSNQSGVAKGDLTHDKCKELFKCTNKLLGMDIDVAFCPHRIPPISCYCRKPMPGLGVQFIEKYKLDPKQCIMVGDMTTDKTFAARCGFRFLDESVFFSGKLIPA